MTTQKDQQQYGPTAPTTLELRGFRFMSDPAAGTGEGAGAATDAGAAGAATADAAGAAAAATDGQKPADTAAPVNPATGQPYTAAETQAYLATLRGENKTAREAAEAAKAEAKDATEQRDKVLAALGLNADGTAAESDPAEIAQKFEEAQQKLAETQRENALIVAVHAHAGNLAELRDSRTFMDKLTAIDPSKADDVAKLVKDTIAGNDRFKAAPPPAAGSGGTSHQGAGGNTAARPSLTESLKQREQSRR